MSVLFTSLEFDYTSDGRVINSDDKSPTPEVFYYWKVERDTVWIVPNNAHLRTMWLPDERQSQLDYQDYVRRIANMVLE